MYPKNPMSHSYVSLIAHIVFSTKGRLPFLVDEIRPTLYAYIAGIQKNCGCVPIIINGTDDHLHSLAMMSATSALSDILRDVKACSSGWIHREYLKLVKFGWLTGYGAFSVSNLGIDVVQAYIMRQEAHHKRVTYKEEFLRLLEEVGIPHDTRYLWD